MLENEALHETDSSMRRVIADDDLLDEVQIDVVAPKENIRDELESWGLIEEIDGVLGMGASHRQVWNEAREETVGDDGEDGMGSGGAANVVGNGEEMRATC